MSNYGKAAIIAVNLVTAKNGVSPPDAWATACDLLFSGKMAAKNKGCPKGAFLGLCEEGVVEGIEKGSYEGERSRGENKKYALEMLENLKQFPLLADRPAELWQCSGGPKNKNSQPEVVIALFQRGYLSR